MTRKAISAPLTRAAVMNCLCEGFLQVMQLDLLSVPSSLTVLQGNSGNHLLSSSAVGRVEKREKRVEKREQKLWIMDG